MDLASFIYRLKMNASKGITEIKTSETDLKPFHTGPYVIGLLSLPASYQVWKFNLQISSVGDNWLTRKHVYWLLLVLKKTTKEHCFFLTSSAMASALTTFLKQVGITVKVSWKFNVLLIFHR